MLLVKRTFISLADRVENRLGQRTRRIPQNLITRLILYTTEKGTLIVDCLDAKPENQNCAMASSLKAEHLIALTRAMGLHSFKKSSATSQSGDTDSQRRFQDISVAELLGMRLIIVRNWLITLICVAANTSADIDA